MDYMPREWHVRWYHQTLQEPYVKPEKNQDGGKKLRHIPKLLMLARRG